MHFLLIHSPLVGKETWRALTPLLADQGIHASVVALNNEAPSGTPLFRHHQQLIESELGKLSGQSVVVVVHSGAGNLAALLDPGTVFSFVFLDAIFTTRNASRFDLFDDAATVDAWQRTAKRHGGVLPSSMIARFAEQIDDSSHRHAFVAELADVPVALYEEPIPVHPEWPNSARGLYIQWSNAYEADAIRAENAGFEVIREPASHFAMLNQPDKLSSQLSSLRGRFR